MKVLMWDVETFPLVVNSWTLWPRSPLSFENIIEESGLICAAWKWLDSPKVEAVAVDPRDPKNDFPVVKALHKVLSEADVVVAHYGDRFDMPKFKARAIFYGLPPIPPLITIDTKTVSSKVFGIGFNSHKLDYLGHFLGLGRKIGTSFSLWQKVAAGDEKALNKMVRYNKQDVRLLEKVYKKLRPYMTKHPNENLFVAPAVCPVCGSEDFYERGYSYTRHWKRKRYSCKREGCGAWFSGETVKAVKYR